MWSTSQLREMLKRAQQQDGGGNDGGDDGGNDDQKGADEDEEADDLYDTDGEPSDKDPPSRNTDSMKTPNQKQSNKYGGKTVSTVEALEDPFDQEKRLKECMEKSNDHITSSGVQELENTKDGFHSHEVHGITSQTSIDANLNHGVFTPTKMSKVQELELPPSLPL